MESKLKKSLVLLPVIALLVFGVYTFYQPSEMNESELVLKGPGKRDYWFMNHRII